MLTGAGGLAPYGTVSPPTGTRIPDPIASGQRLFFSLSTTRNDAENGENSLPNGELFMPLSTRKSDENEVKTRRRRPFPVRFGFLLSSGDAASPPPGFVLFRTGDRR